jgi:hypothetical protein
MEGYDDESRAISTFEGAHAMRSESHETHSPAISGVAEATLLMDR